MSEKRNEGWIKKSEPIGIYGRNYGDTPLNLYTKPDKKSIVKTTINEWYNDSYRVLKCKNNWMYVKLKIRGEVHEGWLEPNMQCANQYTTCN